MVKDKKDEDNISDAVEEVKKELKLTDLPGIGPAVSAKLEAAGILDLMTIAVMTPSDLGDSAGVSPAVARKAIQAARKMLDLGFVDGTEYAKRRENIVYIRTGSKNFDGLLGGRGVESRSITEAFGAYGSGKTQVGLTLAVNAQLPLDMGGANGKAVFIDTEGTFRPSRIKQIAEKLGLNPEKVLKNIFVARAFNSDHQILLLDKIAEMIKAGEPIKLLIIDSLTAHFRAEFSGRGQLADRQQKLNRYIHQLMKIAETYNLAVYVTNQVMANPAQMFGDPTTPIGGHILGHACLTGDSLIQLSDGSIKEISQINSDKVISADFFEMNTSKNDSEKVFTNPNVKEIYNIKTNLQINCSGLHRFFSIENFSVVEKEAKNLHVGSFVAQTGRIDIEGEEIRIPDFKIRKIGKLSKEDSETIKKKLEENKITRKKLCEKIGINQRQLRRVLNQEWPTSIEVLDNIQSYTGNQILQVIPVISHKHRDLMVPEFFTPSFAQMFGYFIGDGNLEKSGLRFRDAREEVLQHYNSLFKQTFNIYGKISKINEKNCYDLSINSKEISDLFALLLPEIYNYVGKSKNEVVSAFIRGFFDAEGHINKRRAYISAVQKKEKILIYLQLFLLRLGVRSTIKFGIGRKKMNVLRIIDKDIKDYIQIGFTAKDKQKIFIEKVAKVLETYSYEMMPVRRKELRELLEFCGIRFTKAIKARPENYEWVSKKELEFAFRKLINTEIKDRQIKQKIGFIEKLLNGQIKFEKIREINIKPNNEEFLYDFSVPERENYVANGFIVHNSTYRIYLRRGKAGSRVAKLIDSPNLPENEIVFNVSDAGVVDELE